MSKYFIWVTDYYSNTGEGKLAINYLKKISEIKQNDYFIKSPDHESNNLNFFLSKVKKFNFKKSNFSNFYRYFIFIKGIFYLWLYYLRGKKVIYVNYLPLWNFLIFMLSPPKTIFGPITGTPNFINKNIFSINFIVRKYIFPKFFVLSNFFLKIRNRNIIFSTSLLKKNVFEDVKKKSLFDFQLLDLKINYNNHKKKKLYDSVLKIQKQYKIYKNRKVIGTKLNELISFHGSYQLKINTLENCIVEKNILIQNLLCENNKLKEKINQTYNTNIDEDFNNDIATKMENLYLKLSIAETQIKQIKYKDDSDKQGFINILKSYFK